MLTPHISTVDERMKRNGGFIAGPNHRMLNEQGPIQPEPEAASPAPNYREGQPGQECRACMHFSMQDRQCARFQFQANPIMVCDAFEAGDAGGPGAVPTDMAA